MGVITAAALAIIGLVFLYKYFKVIHECVRTVRIIRPLSESKQSNKKDMENTSVAASNANNSETKETCIYIEEYKQAPGPLPWPILGNLYLLGRFEAPFQGFTELAKEFGDVYTLTLGSTRCLIVNNLNLIREVLNQNGKFFGGRPDFIRYQVLFGGDRNNSLALCDWSQLQQKRRNLARKHCSPRDASSLFQKMSDVGCFEIHELMKRLKEKIIPGEEMPIKPIIQQACANMFSQYMCSKRFDYDDKEFQLIVRCFDEIFWEINQGYAVDFLPWLRPFYLNHMKKIVYWSETIRSFILERIINEREQHLDLDAPEKDFTDALLKSLAESNEVPRNAIIYMLEDFIGGHSAIGNLVILSLAYIVRNPETGRKIQQEIDNVVGASSRSVSLQDASNTPYTLATIYEVLRYCSSPIVPHVATEDVAIAGYGVTKGTIVFINNYELNTSSKYWEQPERFDPSRFLDIPVPVKITQKKCHSAEDSTTLHTENVEITNAQLRKNIPHFLPFSIGRRTCIGQNLVKGFSYIMLANIIHKYDVSCNDISKVKTYPACVAVPPDTFHLKLTPRR